MNLPSDRYSQGLRIRREVLGDAYVDQALTNAGDLEEPLQTLITEYCWGEVWNRDGLDRKTRSLLNIGMLAATNRSRELALHLRGALRNGCTPEELRETILQIAIYVGVPAAIDAMRLLREAVSEAEAQSA